jgi:hypothetical protein
LGTELKITLLNDIHLLKQELKAATEPVKKVLGTNPDMWAPETRYR